MNLPAMLRQFPFFVAGLAVMLADAVYMALNADNAVEMGLNGGASGRHVSDVIIAIWMLAFVGGFLLILHQLNKDIEQIRESAPQLMVAFAVVMVLNLITVVHHVFVWVAVSERLPL